MKKFYSKVIPILLALSLAGCGSQTSQSSNETEQTEATAQEGSATTESSTPEDNAAADSTSDSGTGKTLIAYFTWADNTQVANPDEVDVDATTSASVLPPGNVGRMARWIQEDTGADLFSIQVEDLYSSDYDECLDRASEENAQDAIPELSTHVENMEQYDTIYLGYPNWWYSTPMAVLSFIDEYNLEGKQIVLFCSHGTGGLAGSVEAITDELPDSCSISDNVLAVYRSDVADSRETVLNWSEEIKAEIGK